jgi:hypothetical protein
VDWLLSGITVTPRSGITLPVANSALGSMLETFQFVLQHLRARQQHLIRKLRGACGFALLKDFESSFLPGLSHFQQFLFHLDFSARICGRGGGETVYYELDYTLDPLAWTLCGYHTVTTRIRQPYGSIAVDFSFGDDGVAE